VRRAWLFGFRRRYGASPLHLAGHLAALAIVALTFGVILSSGNLPKLLLLYVGIVIAHDLIFVPIYSGLDRVTRRALARLSLPRRLGVPMINYVRAPALISALLLIIYGPLILRLSDSQYFAISGHHLGHYLRNWLLITAALFLGSALIYAARVVHARRRPAR
jgi:Zn-dependent protease with chaperone function